MRKGTISRLFTPLCFFSSVFSSSRLQLNSGICSSSPGSSLTWLVMEGVPLLHMIMHAPLSPLPFLHLQSICESVAPSCSWNHHPGKPPQWTARLVNPHWHPLPYCGPLWDISGHYRRKGNRILRKGGGCSFCCLTIPQITRRDPILDER